jgi:DNA invertase Pin-like site-specific DNA recombinase
MSSPLLFLYTRFSTKSQENGSSVRRQVEYAARFCEREGVTLDRTFGDEGVSGHKGRHRHGDRAGGLAEFLSLCRSGDIPRGSFLLVESFDRLSREHPLDAMDLLKTLLQEFGIVVVVMRPEMRLTAGSLGQLEGIMAFIEALRSYGESARKSDLSRYNWNEKRRKATEGSEIVGARVPSWCVVKGGKIVLNPAKTKAVRLIFELCRKGLG